MNFFDSCRNSLPQDQHAQRVDAFARFEAAGWPTPALESWHYSDWSSLTEKPFTIAKPALDPVFTLDRAQPLPLVALDPVPSSVIAEPAPAVAVPTCNCSDCINAP